MNLKKTTQSNSSGVCLSPAVADKSWSPARKRLALSLGAFAILVGLGALLPQPDGDTAAQLAPAPSGVAPSIANPVVGSPKMELAGPRVLRVNSQTDAVEDKGGMSADFHFTESETGGQTRGESLADKAFHAHNPGNAMNATISANGISFEHVRIGGAPPKYWEAGLRADSIGYGANRSAFRSAGRVTAEENRVELAHGSIVEWFVNKDVGIEHGFDLSERPGAAVDGEPLSILLAVGGELRPQLVGSHVELASEDDGTVFSYSGLYAYDSSGRELPSQMAVRDGMIALEVDDSAAAYPITIDPVIAVGAIGNHFSPEYNPRDGRWWTMTTVGADEMGVIDVGGTFSVVASGFGGGGATPDTVQMLHGIGAQGTNYLFDCNVNSWFTHDVLTGNTVDVGGLGFPLTTCGNEGGVATNGDGTILYARFGDSIYAHDPVAVSTVLVASDPAFGPNRLTSLEWDGSSGTLIGLDRTPGSQLLYRIDPGTGAVTPLPLPPLPDIGHIIPDPDTGFLFAHPSSNPLSLVWVIDPANSSDPPVVIDLPDGSFSAFTTFGPPINGTNKSLYGIGGTSPNYDMVELADVVVPEISMFDGPTDSDPPLADGQTEVVDFGCTQPNVPIVRKFTVRNDGVGVLKLTADGLTLPTGYSLNPPWPTDFVAPEILLSADPVSNGAVDADAFGVIVRTMPSQLSILSAQIRVPTGLPGPPTQQPHFNRNAGVTLVDQLRTGPTIDDDPVVAGDWECPTPAPPGLPIPPSGNTNPNGDICIEYTEPQLAFAGRYQSITVHFSTGALTGSLADPSLNGEVRFGVPHEGMNPPAIPGGTNNGDGDNFGIGGIEGKVLIWNSITASPELLEGEFQDDGIDNQHSEVTLTGTPVEVPVPIELGPGETYTFSVELNSATDGVYSGDFSLENNDSDENPFNFPITGIVDGTPPTIVGLPADITVDAVGNTCSQVVNWIEPTATDNIEPPSPMISQTGGLPNGGLFPVGTTVVTYTATDCAGNTTVESFDVTVLDKVPPTFGPIPPPIVVTLPPGETSAVITYPLPEATDNCDPNPTVTCDPPPGTPFGFGCHQIVCTATDSSGNTATATITVIVKLAPGTVVEGPTSSGEEGVPGDSAPGTGASFVQIYGAHMSNNGQILLEAEIGSGRGLWAGTLGSLQLVAAGGIPSVGGEVLDAIDRYTLAANGEVALRVRVVGASRATDEAHWRYTPGSGVSSVAEEGGVADGVAGASYSKLYLQGWALNDAGGYYHNSVMFKDGVTVTDDNNAGIWLDGVGLVLQEGAPVAAIPGAVHGRFNNQIAANDAGMVAFDGWLRDGPIVSGVNNSGVFSGMLPNPQLVAQRGDPAPVVGDPGNFDRFPWSVAMNASGRVAFLARLTGPAPLSVANDEGIWTDAGGALEQVAREGEAAPGFGDPTVVFSSFADDILVSDSGQVLFRARVRGGIPELTAAEDDAIYGFTPGGGLQLIAGEGFLASGTASVWYNITGLSADDAGEFVFDGILRRGVGGVTRRNDQGVWGASSIGTPPQLIVRGGDTFADKDGDGYEEVVHRPFISVSEDGGTSGRSSAVACGNVAVVVTYAQNRRSTLWIMGIPDPPPAP